ncbi:Dam family site-specific DNA-(adenine-N6)-methyltransferase [Candidatus Poribacteria bacterium]|nr:Dam family site-specific DNA-(adenine-N6)-methyltransferase [Candidatus Poribacteria bacterium]
MDSLTGLQIEAINSDAKPFLKWAGGKQKLLDEYDKYFPTHFNHYFEPFVGGGAVFFHLWNIGKFSKEVFLFDSNKELINTYRVVRDKIEELITAISVHKKKHNKDYYYKIRSLDRKNIYLNNVERAARTIYLNKTCYNGLYRVNSKGQFNVPMGSYKNPSILYEEVLRTASKALQIAHIECMDFREIVDYTKEDDFIYFDPPYKPVSKTSSFTSYTSDKFNDKDQKALAYIFNELTRKKCLCMLSNSYSPLILELYKDFRIEIVRTNRSINSNPDGRGDIKEVVVLNY